MWEFEEGEIISRLQSLTVIAGMWWVGEELVLSEILRFLAVLIEVRVEG